MDKPQYELVPLRAAVLQCRTNILAFQNAISKEEEKIDELEGYIKVWVDYNRENHDSGQPDNES